MDVEKSLLTKALNSGQVEKLITSGIDETHFYDEECRGIWAKVIDHTRTYKSPPSLSAIKKDFTDFKFVTTTDTLDYLVDEFIILTKKRLVQTALYDIARDFKDPERLKDIDITFLEYARDISTKIPASSRIARFSEMDQRIADYKDSLDKGIKMGITTGIPKFDELTLGIQPHEFICIVGWQGTGKSTLLQWNFFSAYLAGFTPLLVSLEMESDALYRKWDTMAVHFEYYARKALELGVGDMEKWEKWGERAANASNDIIVLDDLGRCTVEKIYAETVRYKPDLVGVDYISLMDAPRGVGALWEKVTYLTQGLKHNARSLGIPVFGVAQTNILSAGEGAKLENISYSRSIGQDADIVFGLNQNEDMEDIGQMEVRMLKNRDGKRSSVKLLWDMSIMEFREWNPVTDEFQRRNKREILNGKEAAT